MLHDYAMFVAKNGDTTFAESVDKVKLL